MNARYLHIALLTGLNMLMVGHQAIAMDCDTEVPVELGDKPAMDAYADYSDFLVAIMDYKSRDRALLAQQEACPELFVKQVDPATLDPTVTYGPETLDSALERTTRLPGVDYRGRDRFYDRSTARSFALPTLASGEMENESIRTPLRTIIDGKLDDREQQLILSLQGPLPPDDGVWGADAINRLTYSTLSERERETDVAFALTDFGYDTTFTSFYPDGGYITVYYRGNEVVLMRVLQVACLGPC